MKKLFYLVAVALTALLTACGGSSSNAGNTGSDNASEEVDFRLYEEVDNRPPIVKGGLGFQLELPASADNLTCTLASNEQVAELNRQGIHFLTRPLSITRNGEEHVNLGRVATVQFDIPESFPKDRYDELVGILITENGPKYKIPDYYALREGVVRFETSHFCVFGAGADKAALRKRFIEQVAVNGWGRNMNNKMMEPTWREQIKQFANDHCMGDDDLIGIALREVLKDKDIVKIGIDIVNAHDMEDATFEQRLEVASENMLKVAQSKLLSYFFKKLKEEDTKKVKVMDELKSEKIGETVYKTEIQKIDSRRNKIVGVLQDHFSVENVEKVSTFLGEDPSAEKCYIYACEYVGNFALEQWKSKVEELVPYIGHVKKMAQATEIWKKFWASTQMNDLYEQYEKLADSNHGLLDKGQWDIISRRVSTPEFLHGMTDAQIREKIEQRYLEKKEIERRIAEETKYVDMIESIVDLNSPCLESKHFDYVQRLTIVNNLIDRFYEELADEDGDLVFYDDGYKRVYSNPNTINEQLCYVVNEYFRCYPDRDAFYRWLSKNGYNYGQLKKEYDRLDNLLWKDEPEYNPDIHIVIQESSNGANSGGAQYAGHTVCLGKNGKPYKDWYRNIPDEDWVHDQGWSTDFPAEDSVVTLSQYKAIGMPNQVLVYASENDFLNGVNPVKTFVFQVDTMNRQTMVELNQEQSTLIEFIFDEKCYYHVSLANNGRARLPAFVQEHALEEALSDIHLFIKSTGDDFTFTSSGSAVSSDGMETAHITLTCSGSVNFEDGIGSCSISATLETVDFRGTKMTSNFNLTGETFTAYDESKIKCSGGGPVRIHEVNAKGETREINTEGSISFEFNRVDAE